MSLPLAIATEMDGSDGQDPCSELRASERTSHLVIIGELPGGLIL
jgi:hypothetical protein